MTPPPTTPTGWREIASAPKEALPGSSQRWLLLFGDGVAFAQCCFIGYWGINHTGDAECWRDVLRGEPVWPSHWQLLPDPPIVAGTDALNTPPLNPAKMAVELRDTKRALEVARAALKTILSYSVAQPPNAFTRIHKIVHTAFRDIAAILGETQR